MTTLFQTIKNTALFNVLLIVHLKFAIFYSGIWKALYKLHVFVSDSLFIPALATAALKNQVLRSSLVSLVRRAFYTRVSFVLEILNSEFT